MARRKKQKHLSTKQTIVQKIDSSWLSKLGKLFFVFLVASGVFYGVVQKVYEYFEGNTTLEFLQPIGSAYEFQLKNDTPANFTVKSFRIDPPRKQNVIYNVTEDIYVESGSLPGGNLIYVPAAEFKELDGQILLANSSLKFRVPPLADRTWLKTDAAIVDVHYELEPTNKALLLLNTIGIHNKVENFRYLVISNYWMSVSPSVSINEAIRIFCRDNVSPATNRICSHK